MIHRFTRYVKHNLYRVYVDVDFTRKRPTLIDLTPWHFLPEFVSPVVGSEQTAHSFAWKDSAAEMPSYFRISSWQKKWIGTSWKSVYRISWKLRWYANWSSRDACRDSPRYAAFKGEVDEIKLVPIIPERCGNEGGQGWMCQGLRRNSRNFERNAGTGSSDDVDGSDWTAATNN